MVWAAGVEQAHGYRCRHTAQRLIILRRLDGGDDAHRRDPLGRVRARRGPDRGKRAVDQDRTSCVDAFVDDHFEMRECEVEFDDDRDWTRERHGDWGLVVDERDDLFDRSIGDAQQTSMTGHLDYYRPIWPR